MSHPIDALEAAVRDLRQSALPEDGDLADLLGRVNAAERTLGEWRRSVLAEVQGPVRGEGYELTVSSPASRSFSTDRILADLAAAVGSLPEAVRAAVDSGAARLQFQWTGLRKLFYDLDLELVVAAHEVTDGDEAHVGEVRKETVTLRAVPGG